MILRQPISTLVHPVHQLTALCQVGQCLCNRAGSMASSSLAEHPHQLLAGERMGSMTNSSQDILLALCPMTPIPLKAVCRWHGSARRPDQDEACHSTARFRHPEWTGYITQHCQQITCGSLHHRSGFSHCTPCGTDRNTQSTPRSFAPVRSKCTNVKSGSVHLNTTAPSLRRRSNRHDRICRAS